MSIYTRNLTINSHSNFEERLELTQLAGKPTDLTGHTLASHMRRYADSSTFTAFNVGITSASTPRVFHRPSYPDRAPDRQGHDGGRCAPVPVNRADRSGLSGPRR